MKKLITSILLLFFVQQISALTFYDQLCNFNFNWKKYELQAPTGEARIFHSDKEYIQAHLACVLAILRSNPIDQLDAQQYQSRMHLIEVLDAYREAGNFPMNYYRRERTPVFIDEHHTHCAVGYLLQQTGHEDMALRIAAADNYAWLKDIHDAELPAWQQASGFSLEELKLIQGAYDSYLENAFYLPDKYEVPQRPACMLVYFENVATHRPMPAKAENIWCKGEGTNGVLNGRWEQNSSAGMPWIVGYYENGERSGQWQEYYQGTKQLCRTENWRNDKLNGIRKRFDRSGNLIEEIYFKDGKALIKKNYSLEDSLTWVRTPLDSNLVWTEVYNFEGALIASGHEKIYNPGNLLWFQNIELTALNTASITARDMPASASTGLYSVFGRRMFSPPLVQYKKENDWTYYKEYRSAPKNVKASMKNLLQYYYKHLGNELLRSLSVFDDLEMNVAYDSVRVDYVDNSLCHFYGYAGKTVLTHLYISYYISDELPVYSFYSGEIPLTIKECGQYNNANERIGSWKYFDKYNRLYKTENYLVAWKEEEDEK